VVVDSLKRFNVKTVFKSGRVVARDGEMVVRRPSTPEITLRSSINIKWLSPSDFDIVAEGRRARVINIVPDQIITDATVEKVKSEDGLVVADPENDILKLAVVERHLASDNIGLGLVRGFGLKKGAIASSVAHDSHNIVVVGTTSEDMMAAVVEISKMRGGLSVVVDGELVTGLPLPVAGLMSEGTLSEVVAGLNKVTRAARRLGSRLEDPFMAMSFLALPVIPSLKLTDKGLVDVDAFEFTNLFV
jgi:adenine deaminase